MRKKQLFTLVLLIITLSLIAGCSTTENRNSTSITSSPTQVQTPMVTHTLTRPEITKAQEVLETSILPTPVQTETEKNKPADPFVSMQAPKSAMTHIPNCTMGELVPAVKEPGYGLNSINQLKLYFMSTGDFNKVVREYKENNNAFSMCYGLPDDPYWSIMVLNSVISARNARPTTYNITLVVKSMGVDGPEYKTSLSLTPGQQYPITIYIPIKEDQANLLHSYYFKFEQTS